MRDPLTALFGIAVLSFLALIALSGCDKKWKIIASTTKGDLRLNTYDNSDCKLDCRSSISFVAVNESNSLLKAKFDLRYQFKKRDSMIHKEILLQPHDSATVACGCAEKTVSKKDWIVIVTILSAERTGDSK